MNDSSRLPTEQHFDPYGGDLDASEYHLEFNVFWDDRRGGNVRVCGDITTPPQAPFRPILPIQTPDATDSFIMAPDGRFIGE